MNLHEAATAASEIEADDRFAVVAIGRFELIRDVVAAHRDAYPWGLSVVSRIDPNYKAVLRTREELAEFVLLAPQPQPKPTRSSPSSSPYPASSSPSPKQSVFAFE